MTFQREKTWPSSPHLYPQFRFSQWWTLLPLLTNEGLLVNGKFLNMEIVPSRCACTDRAGIHWLLWFLWCMLIIKVSITTVRSWCKNLTSLSSKMDALTWNMQESSIGFYRFAILMTRSPALLVLASIVSWSSTAWKMLMLVSCRWIQDSTLTRFLSLARLIKSLCMLMQRWLASFCTLSSTPCLSSATLWAVLLSTYQKQRRHSSPMLRWCCQCVILLASRNDKLTWCGHASYLRRIFGIVGSNWADDKNNKHSSMAYYLFVNNATFSWRATISQIIALSTSEAKLMALASCCCEILWARKLALELGFPQLTPTNAYETHCSASMLYSRTHSERFIKALNNAPPQRRL